MTGITKKRGLLFPHLCSVPLRGLVRFGSGLPSIDFPIVDIYSPVLHGSMHDAERRVSTSSVEIFDVMNSEAAHSVAALNVRAGSGGLQC